MTTPISFELAKLLKEKGFNKLCNNYTSKRDGDYFSNEHKIISYKNYNEISDTWSRPTISDVVMWLYKKHGIWIYLVPAEDNKEVFKPFFRGKNIIDQHLTEFFESPTEAYEAAIEYCLTKLI